MRKLWLLLGLAMLGWTQPAQAQAKVELVETFPPGPEIVVASGKSVHLRIAYETQAPVRIWAQPYYRGEHADAGSSGSPQYSGKGELLASFFLPNGGQVDEIRVTAGNGGSSDPEIARWPLRVYSYANAANLPPEPQWVVALRESQRQASDAARRAQAAQPVSAGEMALFSGFMTGMALLGLVGLVWPAWAVWRWCDHWRKWAMLPLAVMGFVVLRILLGTLIDPTSHNLWPFEILMFGIGSTLAMAIIATLRWRGRRRAG